MRSGTPALNAMPPVAASVALVACQSAYGPSRPNGRERAHHEVRVAPRDVAEIEVGRELHRRADEDVAVREQLVEPVDVVRAGEVEHHAPLARVAHRERERHAFAHRRQLPRR